MASRRRGSPTAPRTTSSCRGNTWRRGSAAMPDRRPDVIVIGAGVAGCGIAWRLAQRGVRVLMLERDEPGRGASWAAAGMLTPVGETSHDDAFAVLGEEALRRWE